ncbi:hypothetical protein AB0G15_05580 [Streptosporangium sp. NPDC023825]|uniref:hypothetical protein n=1 Tax=Streptosporangium sp. NPDC023825 TaxID=3154909 RepID=UPI00343ADDA4
MASSSGFSPWQYLPPVDQPGSLTTGGGGTSPYRDVLDARRQGKPPPFQPDAQYPAGYIGDIQSRRGDRLLNHLKISLTKRPYTNRGVHKGTRIDPGDYEWPEWFNPKSGLKAEARGERFKPLGNPVEMLAHQGKNAIRTPEELDRISQRYGYQGASPSQYTANRLRDLVPSWR